MANNVIQVKRTTVSGRTPNTTGSYVTNTQYIAAGEFALNMADGILYTSNGTDVIEVGGNNTNQRVTGTLLVANSTANILSTTSNGWVGVGNSAPLSKFSVTSEVSEQMFVLSKHLTSSVGVQQYQRRSRGTAAAPTIVSSGDTITQMFFQGYDGNSYPAAASLLVSVDGSPVANSNFVPGRIIFTTSNGSTSSTERMRITGTGNVGIGNNAPDATLAVTGTANISGNFTVGGITTFNANVVLGSSGLSANGGFGTAGQTLTSNGATGSPYWSTSTTGSSGTGTGNGTDTAFFINGQTVNTNYTTSATQNYLSAGPITVNSGITVTITTGSRWAIV